MYHLLMLQCIRSIANLCDMKLKVGPNLSVNLKTKVKLNSLFEYSSGVCNLYVLSGYYLGGRRSPAVACWASDHWVASSNPLRGKFRH